MQFAEIPAEARATVNPTLKVVDGDGKTFAEVELADGMLVVYVANHGDASIVSGSVFPDSDEVQMTQEP